jgi:hypothetical protein
MSFPSTQAIQPNAKKVLGQLTRHEKSTSKQKCRSEKRNISSIGIVVVPIRNGSPDISAAFSAIAKDVSTTGIGVIASCSVSTPEVVICLSDNLEARLFRGSIHHNKELEQGWVRFGVKVTEVLNNSQYPQVARFVSRIMGEKREHARL